MQMRRKTRNVLLVLATLALLAGCSPVGSLQPLFSEKDTVFEPDLVGTWQHDDETWKFERAGNAYAVEYTGVEDDRKISAKLEAHLVRLSGSLFLDFCPDMERAVAGNVVYAFAVAPVHLIAKARLDKDALNIAFMEADWFRQEAAATKQFAHVLLERDGEQQVVLTCSTPQVQTLVAKYAANEKAWSLSSDLRRAK
jgi:hypothetical protein